MVRKSATWYKLIAVILAVALLIPVIAACSDDDDDEDMDITVETTQPTTSEPVAGLTVDSILQELLDDPGANAVLRECLGDLMDNPAIPGVAPAFTFAQLAAMSPDIVTPEIMTCVKEGLERLGSGGATQPTETVGECTKEETFRFGTEGTVFGMTTDAEDPSEEIAMDQINEMGGIRIGDTCVKFKYAMKDDKGTTGGAVQAVQSLLSEFKARVIMDRGSIAPPQAWRPYTEDAKVLAFALITPVFDWIGKKYPYTFHMHVNDSPTPLIMLDWVSKNRPDIKKVAGVRQLQTTWEEQSVVVKKAAFPEYGIEYTGTEFHPQTAYDFYPYLTSVLSDDPDALICDILYFGSMAPQARELGFEGTFLVNGAIPEYVFDMLPPEQIEGTISMTPVMDSPLIPQYYKDYRESYKERQGGYPFSYTTFPSYLVPYYVAAAIKAAGSTDTTKLKEVMETQTLTLEFPDGETLDIKMGGAELYGVNHAWSPPQYLSVVHNGKPEMAEVVTAQMTEQYMSVYIEYWAGTPRIEVGPPPTTTEQPATSKPPASRVTIDSPVGAIMDLPGGEDLMNECGFDTSNPQFSMMFPMSLPTLVPMAGGQITDEMVACVAEGLKALTQ